MVTIALFLLFLFYGLPAQTQTMCIILGLSWICQILWSCHRSPSYVYCMCHHQSPHCRLFLWPCMRKFCMYVTPFSLSWSCWQISCCIIVTQKYKRIKNPVKNTYSLWPLYNFFVNGLKTVRIMTKPFYDSKIIWPDYLNCPVLLLFPDWIPLMWMGDVHKQAARHHRHWYRTVTQICTNKEVSLQVGKAHGPAVQEDLTDIFYTPP